MMQSVANLPALLALWLVLSCQGPWSYYPEDPENYAGIWVNAYIISGRPVENICFDKIHALKEARMPGFAFYDNAKVEIKGSFSGKDTTIVLEPKTGKPNCFAGPSDLLAEAGENYELNASIAWDSAGKKTTSNFSAKTYIPKKFKIQRAYDLEGEKHDTSNAHRSYYVHYDAYFYTHYFSYLPPPFDLKAAYFIPEYSDDAAGVLVSMVYENFVFWGENSIDKLIEQFLVEGADTAQKARFGDRSQIYFARNQEMAGNKKDIDSIPVLGINMPAQGFFKLLFYATTNDYVKYRDTYLDAENDSRVQAVYNINGGAGIFAGMLVDTFDVYIAPLSQDIKLYPHFFAQSAYCRTPEWDSDIDQYKTRRECIEVWDKVIWCEIEHGKPEPDKICLGSLLDPRKWYDIPPEEMKKLLTMDEIVTWCSYRDFPIYEYPLCGSAMVRFSKGRTSAILAREVKKWCDEHSNDPEC